MAFVIQKEMMKGMKTRHLLKALRKCCVSQEQLDAWASLVRTQLPELSEEMAPTINKAEYEKQARVPARAFGYEDYVGCDVSIADLKAELSTREHVPNKIEAKVLRREKNKRNRGKGRRNR